MHGELCRIHIIDLIGPKSPHFEKNGLPLFFENLRAYRSTNKKTFKKTNHLLADR